jgi:hypothetical protein
MINDRGFYFDILSSVRKYNGTLTYAKNRELIRDLSLDDLREIVFSWLQSVEESLSVDFEMVGCAAWLCAQAPAFDDEIAKWIEVNPTELRYAIGSKFIGAYWGSGRVVSGSCIEFLITAIDRALPQHSDAYAFVLSALCSVADPVDEINLKEGERRVLSTMLLKHLFLLESKGLHPLLVEARLRLQDFESRKYYAIFDNAKNTDPSVLDGKVFSEVIAALLKWLGVWAKPGWFDAERMYYAGRFMGYACREGIDQFVCEHLREDKSQEFYAVAIAFIGGYWQEADVVCDLCVDIVRESISQFPSESDAHKECALALSIAAGKTKK